MADANWPVSETDVWNSVAISMSNGPIIKEEASTRAIEEPSTRKIFDGKLG